MRILLPALACNGWLDSASFSSPPRHILPRLILCVAHHTHWVRARQLATMNGQLHGSGGAAPCQGRIRGCLTRRSGGAERHSESLKSLLPALACNGWLDIA